MRKLLVFLILMAAAGLARADLVAAGNGDDELRLMPTPCVHGGTLLRLKAEWRPKFKKAQAYIGGKVVFGCWIDIPEDGVYWVLMEGGTGFAFQADAFKEYPGV